jgi:hypothetical protein
MKYAFATTQYPNLLERLHAVSKSREREVGGSGGSDEAALRAGESPTKAERGSILLLAVLVSWQSEDESESGSRKKRKESRSLSTSRSEKEAHLLHALDSGDDEHDGNGSSECVTRRDDRSRRGAFSFSSFRPKSSNENTRVLMATDVLH